MNKDERIRYAIEVTQEYVTRYFEKHNYKVIRSTIEEDFKGIDLHIINLITGKKITCDAKCSTKKNQGSRNFLYTTVANNGVSYKTKVTDYVAYVNYPNEIVIISFEENDKLIKEIENDPSRIRVSNNSPIGRYALLDKQKVRDKGVSYFSDEIFNIL